MKASTLLVASIGAATQALAYPGMNNVLAEIVGRDDVNLQDRSTSLLGDLVDGAKTPTGKEIKSILQRDVSAVSSNLGSTYQAPGTLDSNKCNADTCCVWSYIATEIAADFVGDDGCSDLARGAIRQGFHDAASWDFGSFNGGADGSLLLSDELSRRENAGLQAIGAYTIGKYTKYKQYGIGMADLIQMSALVATVSCPGGPRIKAYVGRRDNSKAAPTGKLPSPFQDAVSLIKLFAAKTFTPLDLVALLGAHSTSKQSNVDPSRPDVPQDSTPGKWDMSFYSETLNGDNSTILTFPSDQNLAVAPLTRGFWSTFAGPGGQAIWSGAYAAAYFRMSLLGVLNLNSLTDCTKVLPQPLPL